MNLYMRELKMLRKRQAGMLFVVTFGLPMQDSSGSKDSSGSGLYFCCKIKGLTPISFLDMAMYPMILDNKRLDNDD